MGQVLDWFQSMMVNLTDEEDFIEIGRILLSVQQYAVCPATDPLRFQVPSRARPVTCANAERERKKREIVKEGERGRKREGDTHTRTHTQTHTHTHTHAP